MALAGLVVSAFVLILSIFDTPAWSREIRSRAAQSLRTLRDPTLADDEKEHLLRGHARRLFLVLGGLMSVITLALGFPLLVVWALDQAGMASFPETLEILHRADFLIGVSTIGLIAFLATWARRRRS